MAPRTLSTWLATLDASELAGILARRPDACAKPLPRDLDELAQRLTRRAEVAKVFNELPLPAVEAVEALQALTPPQPPHSSRVASSSSRVASSAEPGGVERTAFAALFGRKPDDPELDAALRVLTQRALIWPGDGEQLYLTPPLWRAFEYPLDVGLPAAEALARYNPTQLRDIAQRLGRTPLPTVAEVAYDIGRWLAAPGNVAHLVEAAPGATKRLLHKAAQSGPMIKIHLTAAAAVAPEVAWAVDRGLLVREGWDLAMMPAEVALALRGPDWRAPLTPAPPAPKLAPVGSVAVSGEAGSAATALLDRLGALLESCATTPAALRKAGGVGSREIRRLAKKIGADEATVRLLLELAAAAELLAPGQDGVLPSAEYDVWAAGEPATQLATVLAAWLAMPAAPLVPDGGAALTYGPFGPLAVELRPVLLRALDELPPGLGITDPATVAPLIEWTAPLHFYDVEEPPAVIHGLWRELVAVGACAHGAISPLGRALAEGQPVAEVAARLLGSATTTARFQADLTAVVPGSPAAPLRELLDGCADREARGAASIWRFSPVSVRRALDAGLSAADLLARLRAVAVGGALPQPLEYLIGDVARRHGSVRVRAVRCVVRGDDTAIMAEIASARSLAALGLTLLAPTVLASNASPADTLAALRQAGYAPVGEDKSGSVLLERAPRQRVESPVAPRGVVRTPGIAAQTSMDPLALAKRLLTTRVARAEPEQPPAEPPPPRADPLARLAEGTAHLSEEERSCLADAVEHGTPVRIVYTDRQGTTTVRVIEPTELHGKVVEAWCQMREDDRAFNLERINAVFPPDVPPVRWPGKLPGGS